jgi:hypothetical protein
MLANKCNKGKIMKTLKQIKSGETLENPIYKKLPYVVLNNSGMVLSSGTLEEMKNLDNYFNDCEVDIRKHDLHLNDNSKI